MTGSFKRTQKNVFLEKYNKFFLGVKKIFVWNLVGWVAQVGPY